MRRLLTGLVALFSLAAVLISLLPCAEAAPSVGAAKRELKQNKNQGYSDVYDRVHRYIYGNQAGSAGWGANRPRIAVLVNGDENIIVEDRIKEVIYSHLRQKFPKEYFAVMKGTDLNTRLLQQAEEQYYEHRGDVTISESKGTRDNSHYPAHKGRNSYDITRKNKEDADGLPVVNRPRGLSDMRCEDYVRAGRDCGYDYVFALTLTNGDGTVYNHEYILFNTRSVHKNVWLRVKMVDVAGGKYLYRNDIVTEGRASNGYANGRVMERAVDKAMREVMDDIAING